MSFVRMLLGAAPLALSTMLIAGSASADVGKDQASGTGKGIVGGALLGGELVVGIEAIAGVESPWAYIGGAVGGAAAGGVGGYFVEQSTGDNPRIPLLMLAGGMTLLIPTIVGVLSATAYEPPADYLTDKPRADEPVANPPQPDTAAPPPAAPPPAPAAPPGASPPPAPPTTAPPAGATPAPTGQVPAKRRVARIARRLPPLGLVPPALVALRPGALALSVPAVEIQNTYTRTEVAMYGVDQATEVHIPVVSVVF